MLSPVIVQLGMGKNLDAFENILPMMLGADQTAKQPSIIFEVTPPGKRAHMHMHTRGDEIFLVVKGGVSYCANGKLN